MGTNNPSYIVQPSGDPANPNKVYPSRFVTLGTIDNNIVQSVANDEAIGISHVATRVIQLPGDPAQPAALEGETVRIYGLTESCEVFTAVAISVGDKLKPDADGFAVIATAGQKFSARAKANALAGEKVDVIVERGVA